MRECKLNQYAGPALKALDTETPDESETLWHTTTLGQSLPSICTPLIEGSLGLYLQVEGKDSYFALTCRHLVWDSKTGEVGGYKRNNTSQPAVRMLQPGSGTIESEMERLERCLEYWVKPDECHEKGEAILESLLKRQKFLKEFQKPEDRVIGHVYASPSQSIDQELRWTRDWALIELDKDKYVATPNNMVYLGAAALNKEPRWLLYGHNPLMCKYLALPYDRFIKLQDFIPIEEMKNPSMKDMNGDPCLLVAKRGRTTDLTWGLANEVMSVVRWYDHAVPSYEWCILASEKEHPRSQFSEHGDSGSAIFDIKGRVGGILTGGCGQAGLTDTTYATPFEWIMSDMERFLEEKVYFP